MVPNTMVQKKRICITGANYSDGMGDIAHILNVGSSLQKSFPDYEIVYHIDWSSRQDIDNIGRLNQLIDLLKKYNIIQKNVTIKADNYEEYLEAIDKIDRHKFSIYDTGSILGSENFKDYLQHLSPKYKEKISNIDHFIMVSAPISSRSEGRSVFFNNKRVLYILEHSGYLQGVDHEDAFGDQDRIHSMGFSRTDHRGMHGKSTDVGILLEDNTQISEKEQNEALTQVKNKKFNVLLFGETVPSPSDTEAFLKTLRKTLFIPTYLIHGEPVEHLERTLAAIKGCLPNDARDIFLQGRSFSRELLSEKATKSQLQALGFTKIEYMDNTSDKINIIELENEKGGKERILKVLNKVYLENDDYDLLNKKLSTTFIGCSGDNSFQDAVSRGAIPIFFSHNVFKRHMLFGLKQLLKQNMKAQKRVGQELNWQACVALLDPDSPIFTPELITQWKEVCAYLIREYNTHDKLRTIVSNYINSDKPELPVQPSSSALLASLRAQAARSDDSALHGVANAPESLRTILDYLLPKDRFDAVRIKDKEGNSVLHRAAKTPESLKQIMDFLPLEDQLEAIKTKNEMGETVLHLGANTPESLKQILDLLPLEDKLEAIKTKNEMGETVLHYVTATPESIRIILALLPSEERPQAVIDKTIDGMSVLSEAAQTPESLRTILELLSPEERLKAVKANNRVLFRAAQTSESLGQLLALFPPEERLKAVIDKTIDGMSVLYLAVETPESLRIILELLPPGERLKAFQEIKGHFPEDVVSFVAVEIERINATQKLGGRTDFQWQFTRESSNKDNEGPDSPDSPDNPRRLSHP